MKSKVLRLNLEHNRRILIVSDIHGGLDIFKRLLDRAKFSDNDYLFILGDLIERGPKSLETVRFVRNLVLKGNTFALKGNNDTIVEDIKDNSFDRKFYEFVLDRGSIYLEMCKEMNISIDDKTDFGEVNKILYETYKEEINYLNDLPHIIETDRILFAHAGIDNFDNLEENNPWRVMRQDTFANTARISPKLLFVGHYPAVVYSYKIADYGPKRNFQKRVISIDGGYAVKSEGHINMIILDSESNINIDYIYDDDLKLCKVKEKQEENEDYDLIIWGREKLEVIEEKEDVYKCLINNEKIIEIPKIFLYKQKNNWYCMDYTNRFLDLEKGEVVKYVMSYKDISLIKKGQVVGWTYTDNLINI